jgi:hypothetical protein
MGAFLTDSEFTASLDERSGVADKAIQLYHDGLTTMKKKEQGTHRRALEHHNEARK